MWFLTALLLPLVAAKVTELTDQDFQSSLQLGKTTFVKFFAPWCGHCKRMIPDWDRLSEEAGTEDLVIAKVDCTVEKGVASQMKIRGFPTLYLFRETNMYEYSGPRSYDSLKEFAEGGWKAETAKNLPWNESYLDVAVESAKEYAGKVSQIMSFEPTLLPLFFFLGVLVTVLFYSLFGSSGVESAAPRPAPRKEIEGKKDTEVKKNTEAKKEK